MNAKVLDQKSCFQEEEICRSRSVNSFFLKVHSRYNFPTLFATDKSSCYCLKDLGVYRPLVKTCRLILEESKDPCLSSLCKWFIFSAARQLSRSLPPQKIITTLFGSRWQPTCPPMPTFQQVRDFMKQPNKPLQCFQKQFLSSHLESFVYDQFIKVPISYGEDRLFELIKMCHETTPLYGFTLYQSHLEDKEDKEILLVCHCFDATKPMHENAKGNGSQMINLEELVIELSKSRNKRYKEENLESLVRNLRKDLINWLIMYEWRTGEEYPSLNPHNILFSPQTKRFSLAPDPVITRALGYKKEITSFSFIPSYNRNQEFEIAFQPSLSIEAKVSLMLRFLKEGQLQIPLHFVPQGCESFSISNTELQGMKLDQSPPTLLSLNEELGLGAVVDDCSSNLEYLYQVKGKLYKHCLVKYLGKIEIMAENAKEQPLCEAMLVFLIINNMLGMIQICPGQKKNLIQEFNEHFHSYFAKVSNEWNLKQPQDPIPCFIKEKIPALQQTLLYFGFKEENIPETGLNPAFGFNPEVIENTLLSKDSTFYLKKQREDNSFSWLLKIVLQAQQRISNDNVGWMHYDLYEKLLRKKINKTVGEEMLTQVQKYPIVKSFKKLHLVS